MASVEKSLLAFFWIVSMLFAVDPGACGGIASFNPETLSVSVIPMPKTEGDVVEFFKESAQKIPAIDHMNLFGVKTLLGSIVVVEEVSGYIGQNQPGSRAFKFGRNFGFLLGVIQTLEARVELVRPQRWQKSLGLGSAKVLGSNSKTLWKNKLKAVAQRHYPGIKVTLSTADALLILDYARSTFL